MTCILWREDTLYTDSLVEKNGQFYTTASKAVAVNRPTKLSSLIEKDPDGDLIDDWVIGFTWDGAKLPTLKTVKILSEMTENTDPSLCEPSSTLDYAKQMLLVAERLQLSNQDNSFTILIIGLKFNYTLGLTPEGVQFRTYRKSEDVVLGSGQDALQKAFSKSNTPNVIRAFHYAYAMEPTCAGPIYTYQVMPSAETQSKHVLARTAMYEEPDSITKDCALLTIDMPVEPTLVRPTAPKPTVQRPVKLSKRKKRK